MAPRKKSQSIPPLQGMFLAFSGVFRGQNHDALGDIVKSLGGSVSKSITKNVTHLVATQYDYSGKSAKVKAAQKAGIPIIKLAWLEDCKEDEQLHAIDNYCFEPPPTGGSQPYLRGASGSQASQSPAPQAPSAIQSTSQGASPNSTSKKRPIVIPTSDDADNNANASAPGPQKKKAKKSVNGDAGAKVKAPEPEPVHVPVDEECYLAGTYAVYIDTATGVIYDATLSQANAGRNNNKFYRIQVRTSISASSPPHFRPVSS